MLAGDCIALACEKVGLTTERISRWLGRECGCEDRRAKINAIHLWAKRVVSGKVEKAREILEGILS